MTEFTPTDAPVDLNADRRTRILDAAEALFAQSGFDGVTLRQIAKAAEVDLALPNYYFGRKPQIFEAVFLRRARLINEWRIGALDEKINELAPDTPSVRDVVEAYLLPVMTGAHLKEPGWRAYYALVAYVNNSTEWGGRLMSEFFDPMVGRFVEALKAAMPQARVEDIYWSYQCLSGALTLTFAQTGRIDKLSNGLCRSDDLTAAAHTMIDFITAGFEAACGRDQD